MPTLLRDGDGEVSIVNDLSGVTIGMTRHPEHPHKPELETCVRLTPYIHGVEQETMSTWQARRVAHVRSPFK